MDSFKIYTQGDILTLTKLRNSEVKLGEKVLTVANLSEIALCSAKFVLLGIPEDIGVRANLGVGGTKTAWKSTIASLLNMQSNPFLQGDEILVLGHFEIDEPTDQSVQGLRNKTNEVDSLVYPIIEQIVRAGKIPIVIGGGHNNALPIITGTSIALNMPLNLVNIDAHADLRNTAEGRHSGNGFSYAIQHGFLNQYRIFGLHQNYVSAQLPGYIGANANIKALYCEDLLLSKSGIIENWTAFVEDLPAPCGLEIDLDSIANVLSSAITPSGFALNDVRRILLSNTKNYCYLHICEGATALADGRNDLTTGKTIAYLISDFVKNISKQTSQQ